MATHVSIDSDTWWHLRAGKYMVDNQQLITEDVFSYTSYGKPWQYPGLWVQVFMFVIFDWFGPGGLNLWVSLTVTSIFLLVWKTTSGDTIFRAMVILLSAAASAIYWAARPYLVTYILFAITFLMLEKYVKNNRRNLWPLPVLMIIWVNSHGGFLAGFLLVIPYLVDSVASWIIRKGSKEKLKNPLYLERFKHLIHIFLLMIGGSLINPNGWRIWELPFTTVSRQAEQLFIAEWQSPDFHDPYLLPFGFLIILVMVVLGSSKDPLRLYEILLLTGFGFLGLISVRNIFFFVIVVPAIVIRYGTSVMSDLGRRLNFSIELNLNVSPKGLRKYLNYFLVMMVGLISALRIVTFLPTKFNNVKFESTYPVNAVKFIQNNGFKGRVFNSYNYGGYLIWSLSEYPVFVDGRADLHQDETILTWYSVINGGDEWQDVFQKWGVGFVLVEPGVPLLDMLDASGWQEVYRDEVAVIAVPDEVVR